MQKPFEPSVCFLLLSFSVSDTYSQQVPGMEMLQEYGRHGPKTSICIDKYKLLRFGNHRNIGNSNCGEQMCPGPYKTLIGTLNAPNGHPRVLPWPNLDSISILAQALKCGGTKHLTASPPACSRRVPS